MSIRRPVNLSQCKVSENINRPPAEIQTEILLWSPWNCRSSISLFCQFRSEVKSWGLLAHFPSLICVSFKVWLWTNLFAMIYCDRINLEHVAKILMWCQTSHLYKDYNSGIAVKIKLFCRIINNYLLGNWGFTFSPILMIVGYNILDLPNWAFTFFEDCKCFFRMRM